MQRLVAPPIRMSASRTLEIGGKIHAFFPALLDPAVPISYGYHHEFTTFLLPLSKLS